MIRYRADGNLLKTTRAPIEHEPTFIRSCFGSSSASNITRPTPDAICIVDTRRNQNGRRRSMDETSGPITTSKPAGYDACHQGTLSKNCDKQPNDATRTWAT